MSPTLKIDGVGVAAAVTITAGAYFGAVGPAMQSRMEAEQIRRDAAVRSVEAQQAEAQASRDETLATKVAKDASGVSVRLLPASAINTRMKELASAADDSGVRLAELTPGAFTRHPRYTAVPIRVRGRAAASSCVTLLSHLHERFPDLAVSGLSLVGDPEQPGASTEFSVQFVWFAEPEGAGAAGGTGRPGASGGLGLR